jgi:hypothetical protein
MKGVSKGINLFEVLGINPVKEQLYTGAISSLGDAHNGVYWAIRTVDKDSRTKRWDVRVAYVSNGGVASIPYWFKQGEPDMPTAAGDVSLTMRADGKIILTITQNIVEGDLFPPVVRILDPVV